jgi:hypothetical protein
MGADADNHNFGLDWRIGLERPVVTISVGNGLHGHHWSTPPLTAHEIRVLRWFSKGRAAVPPRIRDWWLDLPEQNRATLKRGMASLTWLDWLLLWWRASRSDCSGAQNERGE